MRVHGCPGWYVRRQFYRFSGKLGAARLRDAAGSGRPTSIVASMFARVFLSCPGGGAGPTSMTP